MTLVVTSQSQKQKTIHASNETIAHHLIPLLLFLGVTTEDNLSSSHPFPSILVCHTNPPLHVLLHYNHEPSL